MIAAMTEPKEYDISTAEGLLEAVASSFAFGGALIANFPDTPEVHLRQRYFCGKCRASRPHFIMLRAYPKAYGGHPITAMKDSKGTPAVFGYQCVDCNSWTFAALLNKQRLALWSPVGSGTRTPKTPDAVTHYLTEAYLAKSNGARSAAAAMYRAALEQLLHQQGYNQDTLHQKIQALVKQTEAGGGPSWAREAPFLKAIKAIGNGAIHPNDGDITRQQKLDGDLLNGIDRFMESLLDQVYEAPARKAADLALMQEAADAFDAAKKP